MSKRIPHSVPRRPRGFSLVELMVALVLGLIVIAGLIEVLMATRKGFQLQQSSSYLQQNIRFASERIGWSLHMAGFWGGNPPGAITGSPAVTATGACTGTWVLDVQNAVYGYDGASAFPLSGCVSDADYVKGSDVLVMRYAGPDSMDPAASSTITANGAEIYLLSAIGQQATLFKGSAGVPGSPPASAIGRYVYPYHLDMYYLRPCADPSGGSDHSHCDSGDDGGNPVPTLMRLQLMKDGSVQSQPMIDGIEQMQIQYGVMGTDPTDIVPQQYLDASAMTASDWPRVISVRVSLVARSRERDIAVPHTASFSIGNCSYSITTSGATTSGCPKFSMDQTKPWQFTRLQVTQVVQVRNRVRGLGN